MKATYVRCDSGHVERMQLPQSVTCVLTTRAARADVEGFSLSGHHSAAAVVLWLVLAAHILLTGTSYITVSIETEKSKRSK